MNKSSGINLTPPIVKVCLCIAVFGLIFPIYGIPFETFKLTFSRLGLILLTWCSLVYGVRYKNREVMNILSLFLILGCMRAISLVLISEVKSYGIAQLTWFMEGLLYMFIFNSLTERFEDFPQIFIRMLFFIGLISIATMVVQFIFLMRGGAWFIPFSVSEFGISELARPWTYPYYGGQVMGAYYEYNMAATMCAFYFAVFFPLTIEKHNSLRINRPLIMLSIGLTLFALIGTGSKQGFVATIAAAALSFYYSRIKKNFLAISLLGICVFSGYLIEKKANTSDLDLVPLTIFDRYVSGMESEDITGGRKQYMIEILESLKLDTIAFGVGEGMGNHAAHNAYLIVLEENGVAGFVSLMLLSCYFMYKTVIKRQQSKCFFMSRISGIGPVLVWIVLIYINWAQLNANISYPFLAVSLMYINRTYENQDSIRL